MTIFETQFEATPYYKIDRSEVMMKKENKQNKSQRKRKNLKKLLKERTNYNKQNLFRRKDRER